MTITIFECDHEKNNECEKSSCGWLKNGSAICFHTRNREFAKLDESGKAIIADVIDVDYPDQYRLDIEDVAVDALNDIREVMR